MVTGWRERAADGGLSVSLSRRKGGKRKGNGGSVELLVVVRFEIYSSDVGTEKFDSMRQKWRHIAARWLSSALIADYRMSLCSSYWSRFKCHHFELSTFLSAELCVVHSCVALVCSFIARSVGAVLYILTCVIMVCMFISDPSPGEQNYFSVRIKFHVKLTHNLILTSAEQLT